MASGRTRHVRLDDVAAGRGVARADEQGGRKALLLYVDAAGGVMAAAAGEAALHDLLAGEVEVYTLTDRATRAALVSAVEAAAQRTAWAPKPGRAGDLGEPAGPALTAREREVLRLVARGLTNEAVARALGISERTVSYRLTRIYGKLGVSGRGEAIAWAVRRGLV